ncbi:pickpocket protein 28-like [Hermetia illucens]|uniref:pickpocket protein 28-like n=1 Tax=Hermetia illucens TaxID=343691 RepID=UPI0018CBF23C|nr:pickpocket protein 28-like [Hermetia illucens]
MREISLNPQSLQWRGSPRLTRSISNDSITTEEEAKKNIVHGTWLQMVWGILLDYSTISTIHGIRYILERRRSWWESAIFLCSRLILQILLTWKSTPVIVTFSDKSTPIWEIPFPSIVVCPESRTVNGTFNFTEAYHNVMDNPSIDNFSNLSSRDYEYLQTLSQICDVDLVDRLKFRETANPIDVLGVMASLAPTINYTVPVGIFHKKLFFPDGYFTTVFTDLGVCHQFNGIHQSELLRYPSFENFTFAGEVQKKSTWSVSEGYDKNTDDETVYPLRAQISGKKGGLQLVTQGLLADIDYLCRGAVEGFSLQLLAPDEFPAANKQYIRASFRKETNLIIKPTLMTTADNLRDSPWQSRHCFFADERYLRFFKTYSQDKCAFECLTNYTYAKCNCVKFSMPHTKDMPICQAADIQCYYQAEDDLLRNEFEFELSGKSKDFTSCNCLPACTSLKYEVEIGETKLYYEELLRAFRETDYSKENPG